MNKQNKACNDEKENYTGNMSLNNYKSNKLDCKSDPTL